MLLVRFGSNMSPYGVSIPVIGWDKGLVYLEVNWNQMLHIKLQHQAADQVDFAVLTASVKVTSSGREV